MFAHKQEPSISSSGSFTRVLCVAFACTCISSVDCETYFYCGFQFPRHMNSVNEYYVLLMVCVTVVYSNSIYVVLGCSRVIFPPPTYPPDSHPQLKTILKCWTGQNAQLHWHRYDMLNGFRFGSFAVCFKRNCHILSYYIILLLEVHLIQEFGLQ